MLIRKKVTPYQHLRYLVLVALSVASSTILSSHALAQSIEYDGTKLKIELSDDVQAAIDSGVSLTFENDLVHSNQWAFFQWHNQEIQHRFVVTRHTLSNRYLVYEDKKLAPKIFSSTRETMAYISETAIKQFTNYHAKAILENSDSHTRTPHKMRLRLNKTKLPGPMRLTAFIAKAWDLDSGWKVWQSDQ